MPKSQIVSKPGPQKSSLNLTKIDTTATTKKEAGAAFHLLDMPHEILVQIFSTLSPNDLLSLQKVCQTTKAIAEDGSLWEEKINRFQSATNMSMAIRENKQLAFFELRGNLIQSLQKKHHSILIQAIIDADVTSFSRINLQFADLNVLDINNKTIKSYLSECNSQSIKDIAYQSLKTKAKSQRDTPLILELGLMLGQNLEELKSLGNSCIDYKRAILHSVENNHLAYLQYLVQQKPELIDSVDGNSNSLLMIAASKGYRDIICFLKSKNLPLNQRNNRKQTALHLAIQAGHTQIAIEVMWTSRNDNIDLNDVDSNGDRTTHIAARLGNLDYLKAIIPQISDTLELHPDIDEDSFGPLKPLPNITSEQKNARIRLRQSVSLLSKKNKAGETVLSIAMMKGHMAIVHFCLELHKRWWESLNKHEQIKPLTKENNMLEYSANSRAMHPLHIAIKNNNDEMIRLLIDAGIKFNPKLAPIHKAASAGNLFAIQSLLEKAKKDLEDEYKLANLVNNFAGTLSISARLRDCINIQDAYGQTLLMRAAAAGHTEIVRYLLTQKAELHQATDLPNKDLTKGHSWTALHWATNRGYTDIIELLILGGAQETPSMLNANQFAIIPLAKAGKLEAIRVLLQARPAAIDDSIDRTPLMLAAENGHLELVQFLLAQGANASAFTIGHPQQSCLDFAINKGHDAIVLELIRQGVFASKNVNQTPYALNVIEKSNLEETEKDALLQKLCFLALEHNLQPDVVLTKIISKYPTDWTSLGDTNGENLIFKLMRCKVIRTEELKKYLKDVDPNLVDSANNSLMYQAVTNANWCAISILLEKRANLCVLPSPLHQLIDKLSDDMTRIWRFIHTDPTVITFADETGKTILEQVITRDYISQRDLMELYQAVPATPQGEAIKRKALLAAFQEMKWDRAAKLMSWGTTIDPEWYTKPELYIPSPAKIKLLNYIEARSNQGSYKTYLSFFGCKITGLGYSREEKLDAAMALRDYMLEDDQARFMRLDSTRLGALQDGELGRIFKELDDEQSARRELLVPSVAFK